MSRIVWKIVAVAIVLFWLGMSAQLARHLIYPEEGRMAEVPPEYVAGLFLGRAEPSQLVILEGARRLGEVSIGTRIFNFGGVEGGDGGAQRTQLSIAGWVNVDHPLVEIERVSGRMILDLDEKLAFKKVGLTMRIPGTLDAFEMVFDPASKSLQYRSNEDGYEGKYREGDFNQFKALLAMNGIDIGRLGIGDEAPSLAMLKEMGAELTARRGQITIRGERFHGYLLKIDFGEGGALRLTVSEAGELMRVESVLDYELLAEVFVPAEAEEAGTGEGQ